MNNRERIANRIEESIGRMFAHFRSFDPGSTQYSIFYHPKRHTSWFILIFFADKDQLRDALKNGICFQIYKYISNELDNTTETSNIEKSISFESGSRPEAQSDVDNLFDLLLKRQESLRSVTSKEHKECGNCGHDFDKHHLLCNLTDDRSTPTEGWIICPEEDCNCFQTWSASYNPTIELK